MESGYGALPDGKRRVRFDPTINLGHILTFVGAISAGFSAYSTLDKRQTVQEMTSTALTQRVEEQDKRLERALAELRLDSKETQRAVAGINERLWLLQAQTSQPKPGNQRP